MTETKQAKVDVIIQEKGALACVIREWYPPAAALELCGKLKREGRWRSEAVKMMGKSIMQPRQIIATGNTGLKHSYSGLTLEVEPWIPEVKAMKDLIEAHLPALFATLGFKLEEKVEFNSCLLNEYKDGSQYIGYHSDKESMGAYNSVVTVSLGGSRDFYFKNKVKQANGEFRTIKTTLHNGDIVIMWGRCQELFTHSIPKRAHGDYRISLTYRLIHT